MHYDPQRPAGPHLERRLHIEIARDQLIAGARTTLLRGLADSANEIAFATAPAQFGSNAEQGR